MTDSPPTNTVDLLRTTPCAECGMHVYPDEYHPFAACLMFKQTHDYVAVAANLAAVVEHGADRVHKLYANLPQQPDEPVALPIDHGELWSFFRKLLAQGGDIYLDHQHGSHERYAIRQDAAARERADEFEKLCNPETKVAVRGRWESTGLCGCTGELTNGERPFVCEHGFKTELQQPPTKAAVQNLTEADVVVGREYIWMRDTPHAARVRVDEIAHLPHDEPRVHTTTVQGAGNNPAGVKTWNDMSRFLEACTALNGLEKDRG